MRNYLVMRTRGNILFLILLAVVLFAALAYAVTSSMRGGGKDSASEKSEMYASQILNMVSLSEQAAQRLTLTGNCKLSQLDFSHTTPNQHSIINPDAPSDKRCHVFYPEGGGVTYVPLDRGAKLITGSGWCNNSSQSTYLFTMDDSVTNVGTPANDLIMFTTCITKPVCDALNAKLGITGMPSERAYTISGSYVFNQVIGDTEPLLSGRTSGCFSNNWATTTYTFYHVMAPQ